MQQISTDGVWGYIHLGRQGDSLGDVQVIWLYEQMVYAQPRIRPGEWHAWNFDVQTGHLISARRPELIIMNSKKKKKENLQKCGLCCPGWPQNITEKKRKKE